MSAEILRRAAALIRKRAQKATEGPWIADGLDVRGPGDWMDAEFVLGFDACPSSYDAEHIASWHPDVAVAVADLLDATAAEHESDSGNPTVDAFFADLYTAPDVAALALANAYLEGRP